MKQKAFDFIDNINQNCLLTKALFVVYKSKEASPITYYRIFQVDMHVPFLRQHMLQQGQSVLAPSASVLPL
jgi:hypothetical protein